MPFSKTFPKTTDKSVYPRWIEVFLSEAEEKEQEDLCRKENMILMKECIDDAKKIFSEKKLKSNKKEFNLFSKSNLQQNLQIILFFY